MGKVHTDSFECGLCERNFGNSESLETHLNTFKVYRCRKCFHKQTNISNIKAHAEKKHPGLQATLIFHLKMKRNAKNEVSSTEHSAYKPLKTHTARKTIAQQYIVFISLVF
jgi:hypothetical protein